MELQGVPEALSNGDGFWRSCSGCHESNEGHATGPYSKTLQCHLGVGCRECGGIGAIWDDTDYDAMADYMARDMSTPQPAAPVTIPETVASDHSVRGTGAYISKSDLLYILCELRDASLYRAAQMVADALTAPQPAEPANIYVEARECHECGHVGINDDHESKAACNSCDWSGYSPNEDRCPGCGQDGAMTAACPKCGERYGLLAEKSITWPPSPRRPNHQGFLDSCRAGEGAAQAQRVVNQQMTTAARDVLAERQRQISAEGWTPEHDDAHSNGSLAMAAACYCEPRHRFHNEPPTDWPWNKAWWKPCGRRRNLIKAGALILAEIERLDRAAKGVGDA